MLSFIFLYTVIGFASLASTASTADWDSLNKTLNGHLHAATPLASPCFAQVNVKAVASHPEVCAEIQAQYTNPRFRVDQFAAHEETQSEGCATAIDQQCLLDTSNPTNTQATANISCNQGSVPSYYIQVESGGDVKLLKQPLPSPCALRRPS
jgi:hypothetical protein